MFPWYCMQTVCIMDVSVSVCECVCTCSEYMAFVGASSTRLVYRYYAYPKCTATVARVLMTVLPSLSPAHPLRPL